MQSPGALLGLMEALRLRGSFISNQQPSLGSYMCTEALALTTRVLVVCPKTWHAALENKADALMPPIAKLNEWVDARVVLCCQLLASA